LHQPPDGGDVLFSGGGFYGDLGHRFCRLSPFDGAQNIQYVLPDGPTALGHPANEDLFAGTPVRAATSWRVYLVLQE
jgi:hypothetical protein